MRIFAITIAIVFFILAAAGAHAGPTDYEAALAAYFTVPEAEIVRIHQSGIAHEEIPVVLYLAQQGKVTASTIVDLRRQRGMSWQGITLHVGLDSSKYRVDTGGTPGPPYDNAINAFNEIPEAKWKFVPLQDPDIVNLVNLRFLTEYLNVPADAVMSIRSRGQSLIATYDEVRTQAGR